MHVHVVPNAAELEAKGVPLDQQRPAEVVLSTVEVDGYSCGYADMPVPADVPQSGIAVLIPGFTSAMTTFFPLLAPLAARGYRVIAISQRGQAGSAGPQEVSGYDLSRLATDVTDLLNRLGITEPVHLFGHSFGGVVAAESVIAAPKKFASLTLWNSGPTGITGEFDTSIEAIREHGTTALWVIDRKKKGLDPLLDRPGELNPVERYYFERLAHTEPAQLMAALGILRDQVDRTPALAVTGVPVLISHGQHDDAWPIDRQRAMAEQLGAHYWVIANAGHSAHLDRTHTSAQLLATFWDEHSPT